MYLMRIGQAGEEVPAVRVGEDHYVDVSDLVGDIDASFLASDTVVSLDAVAAERAAAGAALPLEGVRTGPPIVRPHQILCVGLNYADHAAAIGASLPAEPVITTKAPNTLAGPEDLLVLPPGSAKTDWEVELGVVIGQRAYRLSDERDAEEAIAGYTLVNDVSERALQFEHGGQWVKGKSAPTFTPCGPVLATRDEIADVRALDLRLDVNRRTRQRGSTKDMVFGPTWLVHYLSHFMVLEPGDLICTGTPAGTGMTSEPAVYLSSGDVVDVSGGPLGVQRSTVTDSGRHLAPGAY